MNSTPSPPLAELNAFETTQDRISSYLETRLVFLLIVVAASLCLEYGYVMAVNVRYLNQVFGRGRLDLVSFGSCASNRTARIFGVPDQ